MEKINLSALLLAVFIAAWSDLKTRKIPNALIGAALFVQIILCAADRMLFSRYHGGQFHTAEILKTLAAGAALFALLAAAGAVFKGGIGMGDARLIFVICMYAGPGSAVQILFFALAAAAAFSLAAMVHKKSREKQPAQEDSPGENSGTDRSRGIPLGPAFLAGTVLWLALYIPL